MCEGYSLEGRSSVFHQASKCSIGKHERGGLTLRLKYLKMMANYTLASSLHVHPVYINQTEANGEVV